MIKDLTLTYSDSNIELTDTWDNWLEIIDIEAVLEMISKGLLTITYGVDYE
ncbi:hypothetical protein YTPLAS21_19260 [Candidatus Nitrosocosmicus sp.]|nr:hypothetical protein YTPLAS21_19260 [Candidatus Nitrosocosmicus sp.]